MEGTNCKTRVDWNTEVSQKTGLSVYSWTFDGQVAFNNNGTQALICDRDWHKMSFVS